MAGPKKHSLLVLISLLAIGTLVGTGLFVWHTKQELDMTFRNSVKSTDPIRNNQIQLPSDWQWFISHDKTVKFGYPKAWGDLEE